MPEFCNNRVNSTANYVMISNPIFLQVSPTVGGFKSQKIFPKPTALCPSLTTHDVHARLFVYYLSLFDVPHLDFQNYQIEQPKPIRNNFLNN